MMFGSSRSCNLQLQLPLTHNKNSGCCLICNKILNKMIPFKALFVIFGFLQLVASSNYQSVSASSLLEDSMLASMSGYQASNSYDFKKSRIVRSPQESNDGTSASDMPGKHNTQTKNVGEIHLPKTYDKNIIPTLTVNGTVHPIPVLQLFNIYSLLDFDENNEKITLDADAFVVWIDGHLFNEQNALKEGGTNGSATFPDSYITLNPVFLQKLWTPDVYIHNLMKMDKPAYMASPVSLKFNPKLGYVQYRCRVGITLKCPMEFQYYPADTQRCRFFFKSFSYFSDQLSLRWGTGAYFYNPSDANFDIQVDNVDQGLKGEAFQDKIRTFDCLEFYIVARRKLSYHMIQTYIPSVFFIVITWLAFFLPPSMVEARIAVAMTTLLTLATMFGAVRESTPSVSYTKAIDIWMIGCILFVFFTLFEFSLLAWLENIRKRNEDEHKERCNKQKEKRQQSDSLAYDIIRQNDSTDDAIDDVEYKLKDPTFWEKFGWLIERFTFPIYSFIFFSFVVIYWAWLLIASEYYSWELNTTYNKFEDSDGWYVPPN